MADLYVGADGVIHSGNSNGVQGSVSVNTSNTTPITNTNITNSTYGYTHYDYSNYVSLGRKVFYWLFTVVAGLLIGIGIYHLIGASIFSNYEAENAAETVENWFYSIAPFVFAIGGCLGSIMYSVFFAGARSYDLGAIVLALLSAVGGIMALAIALALICFVVALIMYIIGVIFGIIIIVAIIAGLCES